MASLNKVLLIGNLTRDPELRKTPSGTAVTDLRLAVNRKFRTSGGENRDEDRRLYPKHILRGWRGVVDSNGDVVEFNPERAAEFVEALPDWLFDELRAFCGDVQNFLEEDDGDEEDDEELAGN